MLERALTDAGHGIPYMAIDEILATYEGEADGEDWRWIVRLFDGRYAFLRGGCTAEEGFEDDWYMASIVVHKPEQALRCALGGVTELDSYADLVINDFVDDEQRCDVYFSLREQHEVLRATPDLALRAV